MRITYKTSFAARCPVDDTQDVYRLTVTSTRMVQAEDILALIEEVTQRPRFQEDITRQLASLLPDGVRVTTIGWHSGVETVVEC